MSRANSGLSALGRRLLGLCDGAAMLALAGFIVYLLWSGDYWNYINPKFSLLSLSCAGLLIPLGLFSLWRPLARPSLSRLACYVLLAGLACLSQQGITHEDANAGYWGGKDVQSEDLPSRAGFAGREYVRINTGELFDIAANRREDKLELDYLMRGFVIRTKEMDAAREFVLYRLAMYCCFADSTAVGFRVRLKDGMELPAEGKWLAVYGRLAALEHPEEPKLSIPDAAFTSVQPDYFFKADKLEELKLEGPGIMYEWREAEPYAY